ncbi:MAG TPA: HepT-like ribonuclease domain-containing protein [Thermoanaerobaculia bacterium]
MRHEDSEYLAYAARSIEYVFEWTAAGREHFLTDRRTQAAVLYRLQTLTQALRDLTPERRKRYPEVPFREMSGFRNVLVHDFIGLDMGVVWNVVEKHLPPLRPQVARMIAELDA